MGKLNICDGCKSYKVLKDAWFHPDEKVRGCAVKIPFISNTVKCPCLDCVVKVICDTMCKRFKSYYDMSNMRDHFEKKKRYYDE